MSAISPARHTCQGTGIGIVRKQGLLGSKEVADSTLLSAGGCADAGTNFDKTARYDVVRQVDTA